MPSEFAILGRTGVLVDGARDTGWGTPKSRAMLGVLLAHPRQWLSVDVLLEWVWNEEQALPAKPLDTFYKYAHQIKQALKRAGLEPVLRRRHGAYRAEVANEAVDYFRSKDLIERARTMSDSRLAKEALRQAVHLWLDQPLAEAQGGPAEQWRDSVREKTLLPAYNLLAEKHLALHEYNAALNVLDELPERDGNSPMFARLRLETLHLLSRGREASEFLARACVRLATEFGEREARNLQDFYRRFREHAPAVGTRRSRTQAAPHQLPPAVPDFTGREALSSTLSALVFDQDALPRPGVVALDGQGGVGKTQFVLHWGKRYADRFPRGRLYIDLNGYSSDAPVTAPSVVARFLEALDQAPDLVPEPERRQARLQNALNEGGALVVLDNAADAEHVRPLLPLLSSCVVLVTSRDRLDDLAATYGCEQLHVDPLEQEGAELLLTGLIGARAHEQRGALAGLAARSGGLPMVLRLMGRYITTRSAVPLAEFVADLEEEDVFGLDSAGRGLATAFSWSYRSLPPARARVFRLLGLHPGVDFTASVAASLAGVPTRVARRELDALVAVNLLEQHGELDRYRLHDVVRAYAVRCGEDEPERERLAAVERLLDFYLFTARNADAVLHPSRLSYDDLGPLSEGCAPLEFSGPDTATRWCVRERDNVTAIVRRAAASGRHAVVSALSNLVGETLKRHGHLDAVLEHLHLALAAARARGPEGAEEEAVVVNNTAHVHLIRREYGLAESRYNQAHLLFRELGHETGVAVALQGGARVLVETGNVVMGIESHERALRLIRAAGSKAYEVVSLIRLGEAHRYALDLPQSASCYREALELARELDDARAQGECLVGLALVNRERGDSRAAADYCAQVLATAEQTWDVEAAGRACVVLAEVELEAERYFEAKQYARTGVRLCERTRDALGQAVGFEVLAEALGRTGRLAGSEEAWERASEVYQVLGMREAAEAARQKAVGTREGRSWPRAPWRGRALS
ncbi:MULTISPECIES: NB-ARC domain-containing protein [Actinosynnema]|uniref:NB-ARC domain-containing protein n=1 Tax=Actinosynnema TaxID=40566 RepID=UPI0020A57A82|nr:NB-ARC domain-containing protein [Actinosynnema pretiosum]MCP2097233.1 NB-ARC domain-containing protein [Actinosynnema pretiosum]